MVAYAVAQRRRREIGLRLALGAQRQEAVALVLRQGLWLSGIGLAAGVLGAWFASRLLTSQLFHVRPGDPVMFLTAVAVLAVVAVGACYLPARRAARVDPAESLRCEQPTWVGWPVEIWLKTDPIPQQIPAKWRFLPGSGPTTAGSHKGKKSKGLTIDCGFTPQSPVQGVNKNAPFGRFAQAPSSCHLSPVREIANSHRQGLSIN